MAQTPRIERQRQREEPEILEKVVYSAGDVKLSIGNAVPEPEPGANTNQLRPSPMIRESDSRANCSDRREIGVQIDVAREFRQRLSELPPKLCDPRKIWSVLRERRQMFVPQM